MYGAFAVGMWIVMYPKEIRKRKVIRDTAGLARLAAVTRAGHQAQDARGFDSRIVIRRRT